ncbi:hypothetical protein PLICRDRAFT_119383, partial [Plicaturopsis crispa FD-325 SS-3]
KSDIPHRTKLSQLIVKRFDAEYALMVEDIHNAIGRVSFTSDCWSRKDLSDFMALTAHYCAYAPNGGLVLRSQLVAFYSVGASHTLGQPWKS